MNVFSLNVVFMVRIRSVLENETSIHLPGSDLDWLNQHMLSKGRYFKYLVGFGGCWGGGCQSVLDHCLSALHKWRNLL